MIVKILGPAKGFPGVRYNTDKIDRDLGELMRVANFGPLQFLGHLRPQDYINYLAMISNLNKRTVKPQFHAVISAKGQTCSKQELAKIAGCWMQEMGYGAQPYLVIFHKDTENNHVHLVSTRIDREGKKISSAYEKIRAQRCMAKVLGYEMGLQYRFSTKAQFYSILESLGYQGRDLDNGKLDKHIAAKPVDKGRIPSLKATITAGLTAPGVIAYLSNLKIDIIFHSAGGKQPYGYTIIDHVTKQAFKGSEVLPLSTLLSTGYNAVVAEQATVTAADPSPVYIPPVWIADDVDDQQVLGKKRRRQKSPGQIR